MKLKLDHDIILVDTTEVMDVYDSRFIQGMKHAIYSLLGHTTIDMDYVSSAKEVQERCASLESEGKKILTVKVARSLPAEIAVALSLPAVPDENVTNGYFKVEVLWSDVIGPDNGCVAYLAIHFRKD